MQGKIIIIAGSTASGKSKAALLFAQEKKSCVVINADSMQVYQEIPIITAQPAQEEKKLVPHELYGVVPASVNFSAGMWAEMAKKKIDEIMGQGRTPILVGGTGLYIKTITDGISPMPDISEEVREKIRNVFNEAGAEKLHALLAKVDKEIAARLKTGDSQRIMRAMEVYEETGAPLSEWQKQKPQKYYDENMFIKYLLNIPRKENHEKIKLRFDEMLKNGVVEEIRGLMKQNLPSTLPAMKAHGVREIIACIKGEINLEEVKERTCLQIRQYVKRQHTWFRQQMKDGIEINGFEDLMKREF